MESERADVSDETMFGLCRSMPARFAAHGMDLFEKVSYDDLSAAIALSTDDCCFLIDRVRRSMLRDSHVLIQMVRKLAAQEPDARIFGVLLVGTTQGISSEFLRFGEKHHIALLKPDNMAGFIKEKLEIKT